MNTYKRNQVEEAISKVGGETGAPSEALRIRTKRLLDVDREPTKTKVGQQTARYAFYSGEDRGRKSGIEHFFTEYEAFAIYIALRLMRHGWPQKFVVDVLRRNRMVLEEEHKKILLMDPNELFDLDAAKKRAKRGQLTPLSKHPIHLVLMSDENLADGRESEVTSAICSGIDEVTEFVKRQGGNWSFFELSRWAHQLRSALQQTEPKKRGRK